MVSPLASAIEVMLNEYDIYDVHDLAANVGGVQGDVLAAWLKSDACRAAADAAAVEPAAASMAAHAVSARTPHSSLIG